MKKTILFLLFPIFLFGQSFLISNIPLPKTYVQNLDPYPCDETCLQEYIDKEMIFSFLAHADKKLQNDVQDEIRSINVCILNIGSPIINVKLKIAMLLPYKKIGKYASSTTNATFAYLITKNQPFELRSYKIENETIEDIQKALAQMYEDGFTHIIAPMTLAGAEQTAAIQTPLKIFFPTINKEDLQTDAPNLYFGGIDYKAQSDLLLKEASSPLVIFHDKSPIGEKLAEYEEDAFLYKTTPEMNVTNEFGTFTQAQTKEKIEDRETIKFAISRKTTNLEHYLKENEDINGSSCFINTPIVKTSMIMSQLTLYDTNATNILSTQINYDPLILSMTQYKDREKMVIANSITENNNVLIETNAILNNDINYDWINYTTTVGIDFFFHQMTNADREYNIELVENQMLYPIHLLKPSVSRFITYTPIVEPQSEEPSSFEGFL